MAQNKALHALLSEPVYRRLVLLGRRHVSRSKKKLLELCRQAHDSEQQADPNDIDSCVLRGLPEILILISGVSKGRTTTFDGTYLAKELASVHDSW